MASTSFDAYCKATRDRLEIEFECCMPRFFDRLPATHVAAVRAVLTGGKRLRACLLCLVNDAFAGAPAAATARAMAVECVHAASLIHDDLVDGDTLRRDRAATWTTQGPRSAVLLGDLIFATALQRMTELGRDDGLALGETIAAMAAGAYQESVAGGPECDAGADMASLYPKLIYLKTGILFGTAARLGALAARLPAPLAALAFEYGARTGEAYQMADDLQDLIELAGDGLPTPAQLPLLAPALRHFCAEVDQVSNGAVLTAENAAGLRPQLRSRMLAEVEVRLQQAMAAADQLPSVHHGSLLRSAPREIVRTMRVGAP